MGLFDGIDLGDEPDTPYVKPPVNREYDGPGGDYYDDYESLDDKKTKEQIRQLKIKNEKELGSLFEKSLMVAIVGEVGQSIQNNFVDQAKRKAYTWANLLGCPDRERDIEKMISDLVEDGINGVIMDIDRLSTKGIFE
jgi:hypothetical protein